MLGVLLLTVSVLSLQLVNILQVGMLAKQLYHVKCRGNFYPRTNNQIKRFPVPDDKLDWSVPWEQYNPTKFTAPFLKGKPWADADIGDEGFNPKFNDVDGNVNRRSHLGEYAISNGTPLNPAGRTGIMGRGILGRWGPNHAADPIITRWSRDSEGKQIFDRDSSKPILQFVAIQRNDSGEWAIPGGMVDAGEETSHAAQREFLEEAMDSENLTPDQLKSLKERMMDFFSGGLVVYKGYVDDPRNTDNSWMETVAINYHADKNQTQDWKFRAGSDAKHVTWLEVSSSLNLYASHIQLMAAVASLHQAHW